MCAPVRPLPVGTENALIRLPCVGHRRLAPRARSSTRRRPAFTGRGPVCALTLVERQRAICPAYRELEAQWRTVHAPVIKTGSRYALVLRCCDAGSRCEVYGVYSGTVRSLFGAAAVRAVCRGFGSAPERSAPGHASRGGGRHRRRDARAARSLAERRAH